MKWQPDEERKGQWREEEFQFHGKSNNQLTNLDARYRCFLNSTAAGGDFCGDFTDGKIQGLSWQASIVFEVAETHLGKAVMVSL
jgi:hypothetical protein